MGYIWKITAEEVKVLRRQVLEALPYAGVYTQAEALSGVHALNLVTSTIENLRHEASGGAENEGAP